MPGGWAGSTRSSRLPADWKIRRARVLRRDGYQCNARTNGIRCTEPATDVDHIIPNDDDRYENLTSLCGWHHARKSSAEGNRAPRKNRPSDRFPREQHPGLT